VGCNARVGAAGPQIHRTGKRVQAFEQTFAQIRPQPQEEVQSPLSGEAERDFLESATADEMKAYFERKYPGGAR